MYFATDLHCAELGPMDNGVFKVTGDHFGARVTYTCNDGYWMSGPKERVCQGDASWSEHAPECKQKGTNSHTYSLSLMYHLIFKKFVFQKKFSSFCYAPKRCKFKDTDKLKRYL